MAEEGAMSTPTVKGILSLLLLAWPSAGLTHQSPNTAVVSLGSDLTLQCLPQMVPNSRDKEVEWCSKLKIKKMIKEDMGVLLHKENGFSNLTFTSVDEKYAGNYTCKMRISRCVGGKNKNCPCKSHKATGTYGGELGGQPKTSASIVLCMFMVWAENMTMHVRWWTCPELPGDPVEHGKVHHSNSHGSTDAASAEPTVHTVSSSSFTGTENATQGMAPSSDPETSPTREPQTWQDLIAIVYMYAIPGLVVVILLLLLCILVCLCRRNQRNAKGTPESKHAAEMSQLSTPPPAPQAEDVTYAKLIFDRSGVMPEASEVVYTEIKLLQKK